MASKRKKVLNPYAEMFTQNTYMAAWLTIDDITIDDITIDDITIDDITIDAIIIDAIIIDAIIIDYPVMQTLEVENHYLYLDFMGMKIKRDT